MNGSIIISGIMFFSLTGLVQAQSTISKNLSLGDYVSYLDLYDPQVPDTTTIGEPPTITDIAGWKDTRTGKGEEYALICLTQPGSSSGVTVVDVSDPANVSLKKIIRYPDPGIGENNTPHDVQVHNNIAYIGQDDNEDVPAYWVNLEDAIDDTSDATAGVYNSNFEYLVNIDSINSAHIHNVHVNAEHELLFLSDFRSGDGSISDSTGGPIQVFDISGSPPVKVGEIDMVVVSSPFYFRMTSHDLFALTTSSTTGTVYDASIEAVTVSEYSWNSTTQTFSVGTQKVHAFYPHRGKEPYDLPEDPTEKPHRSIHSTWIGEDTDYLFVTHEGGGGDNGISTWVEPDSAEYQSANYLTVWNIGSEVSSFPDDSLGYRYGISQVYEVRENTSTGDGSFASSYFSELNSLNDEKANSIHNVHTRGNSIADTAYVSYYSRGIRVLEVTDPTDMAELAFYDVSGLEEYVYPVFNGAFGVNPSLPRGIILGSSSDGLYVFRPVGRFGGSVGVPTRWTTDITLEEELFVDSLVTVQGDVTLSMEADMDIRHDMALTGGSMLTMASNEGISTITASDGLVTIGISGTGGSAKMAGGGAGSVTLPDEVIKEEKIHPERLRLYPNYPNPFNPVTVIPFSVPEQSHVRLEVYDILGRRVAMLADQTYEPGRYEVSWDGSQAASGLYIVRMLAQMEEGRQHQFNRTMSLVK